MISAIVCLGLFQDVAFVPPLGFNTGFIPVGATTGSGLLLVGVG
jgi:hypothetical protein